MAWQDDTQEDEPDGSAEGPDEADMIDEPAEAPCPYCQRMISEDTPRCPHCGSYMSEEDAPRRRSWLWMIAVGLLVLLLLAYLLRW